MNPHRTPAPGPSTTCRWRCAAWLGAVGMTSATLFGSGLTVGRALECGGSHPDERFELVMREAADASGFRIASLNRATETKPDEPSDGAIESGRQVAFATLFSQHHEVTQTEVIFYRDSRQPGNAIQQFGQVFGEAIARQANPTPRTSPLERASRSR